MHIYAQIDENNICHAVSDLSGEVIADNMIPLESYDLSLLGKRYEDGEWVEVPHEEQPQPTHTVDSVLRTIAETILANKPSAEKEGYTLELRYAADTGAATWEYVPIEGYQPANDGTDYTRPITYTEGMTVATGLWYTDGSDIWEAIKDGVPTGFDDREYFDIVG